MGTPMHPVRSRSGAIPSFPYLRAVKAMTETDRREGKERGGEERRAEQRQQWGETSGSGRKKEAGHLNKERDAGKKEETRTKGKKGHMQTNDWLIMRSLPFLFLPSFSSLPSFRPSVRLI
mmetsp:Transcript_50989/g.100233  ORF Transcript_50989/g.100233 Transcript_50989/m.100233 type:complete len:120 (-) Transcript_50989:1153-1512(-)